MIIYKKMYGIKIHLVIAIIFFFFFFFLTMEKVMKNMESVIQNVYNKDFRDKLITDPNAVLGTSGINYEVIQCSKDITYIAIPKQDIANDLLEIHAAGLTASTLSSIGCLCTTAGCVATASCLDPNRY